MSDAENVTVSTAEGTRLQTPRTQKVGRVVSDKMDKTVVVAVNYVRRHPLYHKRITRTSKFKAHDENNECKQGDIVRIEETRPISKTKTWAVKDRVVAGGVQAVEADLDVAEAGN
jgi:small subunit ribosomal protein S17